MPRNEEGEFELVLGNRQLLVVVFVLVVLLGVFFALGYILGRHAGLQVGARLSPAGTPLEVSGPRSPAAAEPTPQQPPARQGAQEQVTAVPSQAREPQESSASAAKGPASPAQAEPAPSAAPEGAQHPETARKPAPQVASTAPAPVQPRPQPTRTEKPVASGPSPGEVYWQVAALYEGEARALQQKLQQQGFETRIAPVPQKTNLFRVLVGPLTSEADVERVRARLQQAGYKPLLRRY